MAYSPTEIGQWTQQADGHARKFVDTQKKMLDEPAGRGFATLPGSTMADILGANREVQLSLTDQNAKIYETELKQQLDVDKFASGLEVEYLRLALEMYKAAEENAQELIKAQSEGDRKKAAADVQRLKHDVEKRQAAIIRLRATIEHEINIYREQAMEAERLTLDAELELVLTQMQTAQKKLSLLAPMQEVIAAQKLVIVAEQEKAAALEKVVAKEEELAAVKLTMIPLYIDKAAAQNEFADATRAEIPIQRQIIELGYKEIDLKNYEEDVEHQLRLKENQVEQARLEYQKAEQAYLEAQERFNKVTFLQADNTAGLKAIQLKGPAEIDKAYQHGYIYGYKRSQETLAEGNYYVAQRAAVNTEARAESAIRAEGEAGALAATSAANKKYTHKRKSTTKDTVVNG